MSSIFCARDADHAPFLSSLADLAFYDQVHLHLDDNPDSALDLARQLSCAPDNSRLYVCGPQGFMETIEETARRYLPDQQIHQESFATQPQPTTKTGIAGMVSLSRSSYAVPAKRFRSVPTRAWLKHCNRMVFLSPAAAPALFAAAVQ